MKNQPKIKILRIQSRICIGGPAIHTELLSRYLDSSVYETVLLGGAVDPEESSRVESLRRKGIQVHLIEEMGREISFRQDIKAIRKVYRIIKKERPDIVHTHTAKAGAVGRIAAWLAGVPVIIHTFHGHVFNSYFGKLKTNFFIFFERFLARLSSGIIVISPAQKKDIVEKYKIVKAGKVTIIRLGFKLEQFLSQRNNYQLKNELRVKSGDILIGIIGRLVPIKNHAMIINVLAGLRQSGLKVHLCIVGDGELRDELQQLALQNGVENFTHFLGWRLDIPNIYAGIDLLALTSLNEGTPVTIIEAMASKVPVVATRVGGVPDLIIEGKTGFLCDVNDTEQMAGKIERLILDKSIRKRITENAGETVQKIYHYSRLVRDIEDLYQNFLNKTN